MRTITALLLAAFGPTAALTAQDAPSRTLFTNVMVWDGSSDSRTSADVLVEGNMIVRTSRNGTTQAPPYWIRPTHARVRPVHHRARVGASTTSSLNAAT